MQKLFGQSKSYLNGNFRVSQMTHFPSKLSVTVASGNDRVDGQVNFLFSVRGQYNEFIITTLLRVTTTGFVWSFFGWWASVRDSIKYSILSLTHIPSRRFSVLAIGVIVMFVCPMSRVFVSGILLSIPLILCPHGTPPEQSVKSILLISPNQGIFKTSISIIIRHT